VIDQIERNLARLSSVGFRCCYGLCARQQRVETFAECAALGVNGGCGHGDGTSKGVEYSKVIAFLTVCAAEEPLAGQE
jgi:hypothetical protein